MMTVCSVIILIGSAVLSLGWAEVFSSTARLQVLFESTLQVEQKLEDYIQEEEERLANIRSMMDNIRAMTSKPAREGVKFVEHPLGAFQFIKQYAKLTAEIDRGNDTKNQFHYELERSNLKIPNDDDYLGSASAILRLQRIYQLSEEELMKGYVRGRYIAPLTVEDAFNLGAKANEQKHFAQAIPWYDIPLRTEDPDPYVTHEYRKLGALGLVDVYLQHNDLEHALSFAQWASTTYPDDPRLTETLADVLNKSEGIKTGEYQLPAPVTQAGFDEKYAALCRGEVDWNNKYLSRSYCIATSDSVPYRLVKQEILSFDPFISVFYDVLTEAQGEYFRQEARKNLNRALVGSPESSFVSDVRVGQLTWLNDDKPEIQKISNKVMDLTGLDVTMRAVESSSEAFQIVNYGIGGHYEPHMDVYDNKTVLNSLPSFLMNSGDRIATFLFYLDDVVEGGSTVFPRVGVRVPAIKNGAAFWYNLHRTGENDDRLTHAGCPVLLGQKWVANKWIRERGQEFRHSCGLTPDTPHYYGARGL